MQKYRIFLLILFIGIALTVSILIFEKNFIPLYLTIIYIVITIIKYVVQKYDYTFYLLQTFIVLFIAFELIFLYVYLHSERHSLTNKLLKNEVSSESYYIHDPLVSYRFKPNLDGVNSKLLVGEEIIYDVYYSSDRYWRRVEEWNKETQQADKHAIFLGGSYTFWEWLPYNWTIPYLFEKNTQNVQTYNYSFKWHWPHQLALLFPGYVDLINYQTIQEKDWYLIYVYIDDHHNRVYGWSRYLWYGSDTYQVKVENWELVLSERNPIHLLLAKIVRESATFKYFRISIMYPKSDNYYKQFTDIINYQYSEYISLFPNWEFYIALYPIDDTYERDRNWLKFLNKDIKIIDVPRPEDFSENLGKYIIHEKYERHATSKLNSYFTDYLIDTIKQ